MSTVLSVKGLNAGYGPIHVIWDLELEVPDKEVTVIVGPNGVGKSTLLKAIMGTVTRYSGNVNFMGEDITNLPAHERTKRGLGYMPQVGNIFSRLKVRENLKMAAYTVDGNLIDERLETCFELFPRIKPFGERAAGTLSGGERQMLAASMALMRGPKVLMVDEPTAALQPSLVTDVLKKIVDLKDTLDLPILMVEQRARRALEVGDDAYMMRGGRFTFKGSSKELLAHPQLTEMYLGEIDVHELKYVRE
jgi:branched-chain amino acid transport system ATP-binding protein